MSARRCRLCRKPCVDDSIFCDDHRNQAALFSASFGTKSARKRAKSKDAIRVDGATATVEATAKPEGGGESDEVRRRPATSTPRSRTGSGSVLAAESEAMPEADLATLLTRLLADIRGRMNEQSERTQHQWPQLSLYFLDDELIGRAFYSIVPTAIADQKTPVEAFGVDDPVLDGALEADGVLFREIQERLEEHGEALRLRDLQTLDVHLLTYAGLVAINAHTPCQRDRNIVTFRRGREGFEPIPNEEARPRLGHERW